MNDHKDVYELLGLYEGPKPREAFKPHLQPDDWKKRAQVTLHFRSEVPDLLEPAYDIAIADGLLEHHILLHFLTSRYDP